MSDKQISIEIDILESLGDFKICMDSTQFKDSPKHEIYFLKNDSKENKMYSTLAININVFGSINLLF